MQRRSWKSCRAELETALNIRAAFPPFKAIVCCNEVIETCCEGEDLEMLETGCTPSIKFGITCRYQEESSTQRTLELAEEEAGCRINAS